jgi:hypothetical protein
VRTFYFDIDGTILREDTATAKPALAAGRFERLVRSARFDGIVCVGNMVAVLQQLEQLEQLGELGLEELDRSRVVFDYCDGAFADFAWFRRAVSFVEDPHRRVRYIARDQDWWYVDDLAPYYFDLEGKRGVLERERGRRVFVPRPNGDGRGLAEWLEEVPSG